MILGDADGEQEEVKKPDKVKSDIDTEEEGQAIVGSDSELERLLNSDEDKPAKKVVEEKPAKVC